MSPDRMSATSVAHKSTGGTLQSLPEPVDPVGDAPDYLTFKTVAPLSGRRYRWGMLAAGIIQLFEIEVQIVDHLPQAGQRLAHMRSRLHGEPCLGH